MTKICGTCKWCVYKSRYGAEPTRDGYCYANPPMIGIMRPKTKLKDDACSLYQPISKNTTKED